MAITTRRHAVAALAACAGLMAGCGGGGDDSGPDNTGVSLSVTQATYVGGSTRGPVVSDLLLAVLPDGSFWALYSVDLGDTLLPTGVIHANASATGSGLSASDTADLGLASTPAGRLSAQYGSDGALAGTVVDTAGTVNFNASPLPAARYDPATPATLASVQGSWTMRANLSKPTTLTIAADGRLTGSIETDILGSRCSFTGTLAPHPSGRNLFTLTLVQGSAPCALAGQTTQGIGVATRDASGRLQLSLMSTLPSRTAGLWMAGKR